MLQLQPCQPATTAVSVAASSAAAAPVVRLSGGGFHASFVTPGSPEARDGERNMSLCIAGPELMLEK